MERDKKITFQEALSKSVDHAIDDDEYIQDLLGTQPLEEEYAWRMLDKPRHTGIKDLSSDIDKWLYEVS